MNRELVEPSRGRGEAGKEREREKVSVLGGTSDTPVMDVTVQKPNTELH